MVSFFFPHWVHEAQRAKRLRLCTVHAPRVRGRRYSGGVFEGNDGCSSVQCGAGERAGAGRGRAGGISCGGEDDDDNDDGDLDVIYDGVWGVQREGWRGVGCRMNAAHLCFWSEYVAPPRPAPPRQIQGSILLRGTVVVRRRARASPPRAHEAHQARAARVLPRTWEGRRRRQHRRSLFSGMARNGT